MRLLSSLPPVPLGRVGMIARWQPVHLGHAAVLQGLCAASDHVLIGLGSSNRRDRDTPFPPAHTARMITLVLREHANFEIHEIPDLGHGPRWAAMVRERFGELELFLTANAWVRDLMLPFYDIAHPSLLLPRDGEIRVTGEQVRAAMMQGEAWEGLVPPLVAAYLREQGLVLPLA